MTYNTCGTTAILTFSLNFTPFHNCSDIYKSTPKVRVNEDGEHYKEIAALLSQYCTQIRKAVLQKDKAEVSDVERMHNSDTT